MESVLTAALEYGVSLVALIVLLYVLIRTMEQHTKERGDWHKLANTQFEKLIEISEKHTKVVEQNSSAVEALRDILKDRKK